MCQAEKVWKGFSLTSIAASAQQWIPNGPPNVVEKQFITTGGITYFRLVGLLPGGSCCQRIDGSDVWREGAALYQMVEQELWEGFCVDLFCPPWFEENVSVLGALPPGGCTLNLVAHDPQFGLLYIWAILPFAVPSNSSPTLTLSMASSSNAPVLGINLAGVSNVNYVLECSTNLLNWKATATNLGAPVTFSAPLTNGAERFYRALVLPAPARPVLR